MKTTVLLVSALAAAGLGACATYDPNPYPANVPVVTAPNATSSVVTTAPVAVAAPRPFRPGWGVVESVSLLRPLPTASASAGASAPIYKVSVRMEDGTVQTFDVDRGLGVGERVELTPDGRVIRGPA
jgi:hypothetical protein